MKKILNWHKGQLKNKCRKKGAFFDNIFFNLGTYLVIVSTALCTTKMVVLSSKQNFCAKFEGSTNIFCTSNCVGLIGTKIRRKFEFQDFKPEIQIFPVLLNRIQNNIQMPLLLKVKEAFIAYCSIDLSSKQNCT